MIIIHPGVTTEREVMRALINGDVAVICATPWHPVDRRYRLGDCNLETQVGDCEWRRADMSDVSEMFRPHAQRAD